MMLVFFIILLSFLLFSMSSTKMSITFLCCFLCSSLNWSVVLKSVMQKLLKFARADIELVTGR